MIQEMTGTSKMGQALMVRLPDRLEFNMSPLMDASASELPDSPEFSFMPQESITAFREASYRIVQAVEGIQRVGVGGKLICPAKDHQDGYKLLQTKLCNVKLDPKTSDFTYTINIAREKSFDGKATRINRLCTWRCVMVNLLKDDGTLWQLYGAEMEPDINTAPNIDFSTFSLEDRKSILATLFDYHMEFATSGESP